MAPKVLIIGAGLAGLALAHILHEKDVPYEVYERDATKLSRKQGWAVALVECLPEMQKLFSPAVTQKLHSNSVNANMGDDDEIGFVDAVSGEKVGSIGGVPDGQTGHLLRVSREQFRNFLLESRDLHVSMGKDFTHYSQTADSVTAHFKDGTSAMGTLLVGADGLHSRVLDQLIGASQHKPVLSQYVPIFGEVELPKELYDPLRALGNAVILAGAPGVRFQIGQLHIEDDKTKAAYFWALMIPREDPGPLSEWVAHASREDIYAFALKETEIFAPSLKDPIRYGGVSAIPKHQPKFLEYEPSEDMPKGRVTVLGDAGHAMIPFRGAGANTAILDSCDMGRLLIEAWKQQADFSDVVAPYQRLMIPRGRDNVISSRQAGQSKGNPAEEWAVMFKRPGASA